MPRGKEASHTMSSVYSSRVFRDGHAGREAGARCDDDLHRPGGHEVLSRDIENLKAGLAGQPHEEAFVPSADPLTFANRHKMR